MTPAPMKSPTSRKTNSGWWMAKWISLRMDLERRLEVHRSLRHDAVARLHACGHGESTVLQLAECHRRGQKMPSGLFNEHQVDAVRAHYCCLWNPGRQGIASRVAQAAEHVRTQFAAGVFEFCINANCPRL